MTQINLETQGGTPREEDIDRAIAAAESVLDAAGVNYELAYSDYLHKEKYVGNPDEYDGPAALWLKAQSAADIALTQGWHDTEGAHCFIYV